MSYSFSEAQKVTNFWNHCPYSIGVQEDGVYLISADETVRIEVITSTAMVWEKGGTRFLLVR